MEKLSLWWIGLLENRWFWYLYVGVFRWRQQWSVPGRAGSGNTASTGGEASSPAQCARNHWTTWFTGRNARLIRQRFIYCVHRLTADSVKKLMIMYVSGVGTIFRKAGQGHKIKFYLMLVDEPSCVCVHLPQLRSWFLPQSQNFCWSAEHSWLWLTTPLTYVLVSLLYILQRRR